MRLVQHLTMSSVVKMLIFLIALLVAPSTADCECGYTAAIGASDMQTSNFLFTDIIESDFLHIKNVSLDTDWKRQNFTVTPEAGRGPYGACNLLR
jgi:hypothetical protein